MNDTALLDRDGPVATLTLNRPMALNSLDLPMVEALGAHVQAVAADARLRVLVIRGAGKHFMAGGDVRQFASLLQLPPAEREPKLRQLMEHVHAFIETLTRMPQPVIASVHGAAAGFGLSLANACDLVYAADDAYFASAYLGIGATPDGGGTWALPRIVGTRKAAEIMLLGERFDARVALSLGIVNAVVPAAELDAAVANAAQRVARGPTLAVRNLKRLLRQSSQHSLAEQLAAEAQSFLQCAGTADFAEGVTAFADKRAPDFHRS